MVNENASATDSSAAEPSVFEDMDSSQQATEIESLCMSCGENGITRLLLTRIPHFREVIVMAFECPHCHLRNNEIQSAGQVQAMGNIQTCRVETREDLNRQIVKSDSASIRFCELDMDIPASTKNSTLTTIEGLLTNAIEDLSKEQPVRRHSHPSVYQKVEEVLTRLRGYCELSEPFTLSVDDPAGNSYIENLCAPSTDPKMTTRHYKRTREQDESLGLAPEASDHPPTAESQTPDLDTSTVDEAEEDNPAEKEVMSFQANCPACNAPCDTRMSFVQIPYFKEVIIMSTACDKCDYKNNEIKSGGAISPQGRRISFKITEPEDLSRDILKSETCGLKIPEIELELQHGTLGGRFTTVEGLLRQIYEELDTNMPFAKGDTVPLERRRAFEKFFSNLNKVINNEMNATLILDDPLANSYLQNLYAPDPDPHIEIVDYERTWEQNEELGLNDIKVENYEEDATTANSVDVGTDAGTDTIAK